MPEAPRAPRSVPPWAASRMTMLELWRCACAADCADCDAAAVAACAAGGAGDATLDGCAEAGAAGAWCAGEINVVAPRAAIAAKVRSTIRQKCRSPRGCRWRGGFAKCSDAMARDFAGDR